MTTESRANSLRTYAENLLESDNTTLADEEISGLVDDLIEFAEQWEAEIQSIKEKITKTFSPELFSTGLNQQKVTKALKEIFGE